MDPYYSDETVTVYCGDCREVLPSISGVTAVCTDPPYGLSFMGKDWDHGVPGEAFWQTIAAACLPGAPLLAFGGTRTYHRLVCAIEDAGWEVRDCLQWIYGSGFPKSHDVSKAIDKEAGAEREVVGSKSKSTSNSIDSPAKQREHGYRPDWHNERLEGPTVSWDITAPATPAAQLWHGWGTALKPSHEPVCLAMNPLDGTFAHNAIEHGVAGLNVDGGRVDSGGTHGSASSAGSGSGNPASGVPFVGGIISHPHPQGRWPANVLTDGSEEVLAGFPESKGGHWTHNRKSKGGPSWNHGSADGEDFGRNIGDSGTAARFFKCCPQDDVAIKDGCIHGAECKIKHCRGKFATCYDDAYGCCPQDDLDDGESSAANRTPNRDRAPERESSEGKKGKEGADPSVAPSSSRFFYCAKASKAERNRGCEGLEERSAGVMDDDAYVWPKNGDGSPRGKKVQPRANNHPTVKPLALMRYLCTLVTMPERNLILDPFAGSGTTGVACKELGLPCILIEQDEHHCEIIAARVAAAKRDEPEPDPQMDMFAS